MSPDDADKPFVMDDEQVQQTLGFLHQLIDRFKAQDGKDRHAALFLFTREDSETVGTHVVGTMQAGWLEELVLDWVEQGHLKTMRNVGDETVIQ